jgi:DNA-binding NtrC family response regulator
VPPLRERREDIVLLAHHFLARFSAEAKKEIRGFSGAATASIIGFNWPGNVRELRNVVERAVVLDRDGLIDEDDLPPAVIGADALHKEAQTDLAHYPVVLDDHLAQEEKRLITEALEKENGNMSAAARGLGIPRTTLITRMKHLKMDFPNGV